MSYIDIGIIVIVALCALIGLLKGLFKTMLGLFGWLITFVIAFLLTKTIAYALLDVGMVGNFVAGQNGDFSLFSWVSSWGWVSSIDTAPSFILTFIEPIMESVNASAAQGMFTVSQGVALYVAYYIYCAIVFVALFIIIKIVVAIVLYFIKTIFDKKEKPSGISKLLGFLVGAIRGAVYVALLLFVFSYASAIPQLANVRQEVDNSMLGSVAYTQVQQVSDKFLDISDEDTIKKLILIAAIDGTNPEADGEQNEQEQAQVPGIVAFSEI